MRFIWATVVERKARLLKKEHFLLELLRNAAWSINDNGGVCVHRRIFGQGFVFWGALFPASLP